MYKVREFPFHPRAGGEARDETPTALRVVRPCFIGGRRRECGEYVTVPRHEALSVVAGGRCVVDFD